MLIREYGNELSISPNSQEVSFTGKPDVFADSTLRESIGLSTVRQIALARGRLLTRHFVRFSLRRQFCFRKGISKRRIR
jgi:hypothetical protein